MSDRRTLLHVDDDRVFRRAIRRVFERAGWIVLEAEHGEDGIRRARSERPDAVLLDIRMPVLDGFQALQALKLDSETRIIPVVMCSGLGAKEDIHFCMEAGAVGYIVKTHHHPEEIHAYVSRLLQ